MQQKREFIYTEKMSTNLRGFFLLAIIISFGFFIGCNSTSKDTFPVKYGDTVDVIYRVDSSTKGTTGLFYSRGIAFDGFERVFEDSSSTTAKKVHRPQWQLLVPNYRDTIRDATGKPIYDSASKGYKVNTKWYKLTPQENKSTRVQVVSI